MFEKNGGSERVDIYNPKGTIVRHKCHITFLAGS